MAGIGSGERCVASWLPSRALISGWRSWFESWLWSGCSNKAFRTRWGSVDIDLMRQSRTHHPKAPESIDLLAGVSIGDVPARLACAPDEPAYTHTTCAVKDLHSPIVLQPCAQPLGRMNPAQRCFRPERCWLTCFTAARATRWSLCFRCSLPQVRAGCMGPVGLWLPMASPAQETRPVVKFTTTLRPASV